jgi:hypothetical protein
MGRSCISQSRKSPKYIDLSTPASQNSQDPPRVRRLRQSTLSQGRLVLNSSSSSSTDDDGDDVLEQFSRVSPESDLTITNDAIESHMQNSSAVPAQPTSGSSGSENPAIQSCDRPLKKQKESHVLLESRPDWIPQKKQVSSRKLFLNSAH